MGRVVRGSSVVLGACIVALLAVEALVRLRPTLIPLALLVQLSAPLALRLAAAQGLPSAQGFLPVPRDDGGLPLLIPPPHGVWYIRASRADRPFRPVEVHHMDGRGFCNSTTPATAEMLTLGDSFTWCTAVESEATWSSVLAAQTGQRVVTLGLPGQGLHTAVQLLKHVGLALRPRTVVLMVYGGNDLWDSVKHAAYKAAPQPTHPPPRGNLVGLLP